MKRPVEPCKPYRPIRPPKEISIYWVWDPASAVGDSSNVPLKEVVLQLAKGVGLQDLPFEELLTLCFACTVYRYNDYTGKDTEEIDICLLYAGDNPNYEAELARYHKDLAEYKKNNAGYKGKLAAYEEEMKEFNVWKAERQLERARKAVAEANRLGRKGIESGEVEA